MHFSIMLTHEVIARAPGLHEPDVTVKRSGEVIRNKPTMIPVSIEVDAPGLKPTYQQLLTLHKLTKGYRHISYCGDAVVLDQPLMALKELEKSLREKE